MPLGKVALGTIAMIVIATVVVITVIKRTDRYSTPTDRWAQSIKLKKGALTSLGWKETAPASKRYKALAKSVKNDGYATTIRRLGFLVNVAKNPSLEKVAKSDMKWVQKTYGESKKVKFKAEDDPETFGRNLARELWPEGAPRGDIQGIIEAKFPDDSDKALEAFDDEWDKIGFYNLYRSA